MFTAMEKDVVDFIKDNTKDLKAEIKEMLGNAITGMSGKVRFEVDKIDLKLDIMEKNLKEHDSRQNGTLKEHAKYINDLEAEKIESIRHRSISAKFWKNWKLVLIVCIIGFYGLHNLFENITVKQIIEFIKGVL
jgi:hypothetical protein